MVALEFAELLEIKQLLKHQHVVAALVCLGDRPRQLRYSQLGTAITEWTGTRIQDGELTRTIHRLEHGGLVRIAIDSDGHKLLTVTKAGQHRLHRLAALGRAVRSGAFEDNTRAPEDPDHE